MHFAFKVYKRLLTGGLNTFDSSVNFQF